MKRSDGVDKMNFLITFLKRVVIWYFYSPRLARHASIARLLTAMITKHFSFTILTGIFLKIIF
jgi:hypothetical protein